MGQLEDALRKWEQILARDPGHALARAYVQDARKDLGLPPMEEGARPALNPTEPAMAVPEVVAEDERIDHLIRDGVQLYDMGMVQEATEKWQLVLDMAPGHTDAEAYLTMARRDLAVPAAKPVPVPLAPEFSGHDFPGHQPRLPKPAPPPMAALELAFEEPAAAAQPVAPVTPPPALTSGAQKTRKGLNLPELLQSISLPGWIASPAFILGTIAGLVIVLFGTFYYLRYRKDEALKQTVANFKANAVSPVARNAEIANLQQAPEDIRKEAQAALGDDSLLAYLRAKELLRLNPGDAAASQLLDRAKADLAKDPGSPAVIGEFEKQLRGGDLESADRTMMALLSRNPDDRILQERAIRLYGAMIQAYASKEQWTEAETRLRRGRAMFPEDKSWSVKLLLLAHIQSMPRNERTSWIQLLG
jgi:tetratricopeptide (TPR) repeat protein